MEVHAHTHTADPDSHRGRKKWTHYFWEFLMLFLAVFAGFLAENQREHYMEKKREKQYIQSLIQDLKTDTVQFRIGIINSKFANRMIDTLIGLLKSQERNKVSGKIYWLAKSILLKDHWLTQSNKTFEQLKSSGNLRLIHKPVILDSIGYYYEHFNEMTTVGPLQMQFQNRHDVYLNTAMLFDAEVFQKMTHSEDPWTPDMPENNPPLLSNDPGIINEICTRYHYMFATKRVVIDYAEEKIELASNLIKQLQKEYHLE